MTYNPDIHHRRSIRLKHYDYSQAGAYFVTICTQNKDCLFGNVIGSETRLNEYGQLTATCWRDLPKHYRHIELDEFIIMPNHIHGIIAINHVGAGLKPALLNLALVKPGQTYQTPKIRAGFKPAPTLKPHGLPEIIRAFKTFSAKQINQIRNSAGTPVWQRNYYEHVIRSEPELHKIRAYIANNPLSWETDENYRKIAVFTPEDIALLEGK